MNGEVLAGLMAQAEARGADMVTLRALVEEASQTGASRALGALGLEWRFDGEAWETGKARVASVVVGGKQVIGGRTASIDAPSAGSVVDAEARACIGLILGALRGHGLIET